MKRPVTGVDTFVNDQSTLILKRLVAHVTSIRTFTGVSTHVKVQRVFNPELLFAHAADIWPVAFQLQSMFLFANITGSFMSRQTAAIDKPLTADITAVWQCDVCAHVDVQRTVTYK